MSEQGHVLSRDECEDMMQDLRAENAYLRAGLAEAKRNLDRLAEGGMWQMKTIARIKEELAEARSTQDKELWKRVISMLKRGRKIAYREGWEKGETTEEWDHSCSHLIAELELSIGFDAARGKS